MLTPEQKQKLENIKLASGAGVTADGALVLVELVEVLAKGCDDLAVIAQKAAMQADRNEIDAARWRESLMTLTVRCSADGRMFGHPHLPLPHDWMRGSVAEHFTKTIDAARKQRLALDGLIQSGLKPKTAPPPPPEPPPTRIVRDDRDPRKAPR